MESCKEAHSLPAHATAKCTVTAADDVICLKEEARADCVGSARNQCCTALEACDGILFDCEGMELCTDAVALLFPLVNR